MRRGWISYSHLLVYGSIERFAQFFDPLSQEWSHTTVDEKIEILKKIAESGEDLRRLILYYKNRYIELDRRDIANEVGNSLVILLKNQIEQSVK